MKVELDDSNYETMISKLAKGSIEQKSQSLRKLLFLYENARSRIYLYERRITQSLQLSLLIEQKDISLSALSLLQKIIMNTSAESQIMAIIKKRLLSKIVLNLGSIDINVRKVSHKCILEYVRKFRDYQAVTSIYLKTAIQQNQNSHLKLKAINSFHSLLMGESKYYSHQNQASKILLQELIHASYQKDYNEVRKAALLCLLYILRIKGVENNLRTLNSPSENQLFQLKYQSEQLAALLDLIFKTARDEVFQHSHSEDNQIENNTPSPKFISIQETEQLKVARVDATESQKIPDVQQFKAFNEVSFAEEFLKKLQKNSNWQFNQIQEFAPFLEKCLVDESIKLFSISKKIVQVIFNSEGGKKKEYYLVLVPCIVNGIGNKRFIVRKNLDKLVRQYVKNHTQVWVKNFIERFAVIKNYKVKQILIDLLMHAYKTSPQFYYPTQRTFEVFDTEINDQNSSLKRKVIDCILLILERQAKDEKSRNEMLQIFSSDPYNKIIRKMGKTNNSLGSYSEDGENSTLDPISPIAFRKQRKHRLVTAEPEKVTSIEKSQQKDKNQNISQEKGKNRQIIQYKQRRVRNSQIEINFKIKKSERKSKDDKQKNSLQRLPQLKKAKGSSVSRHDVNESPVKRSIGQKNIIYIERQHLRPLQNPKSDLQKAMIDMKDQNWSTQFDSINKIRSAVEFNKQLFSEECLSYIVNELLQCLSNLRSGVTKLALMCLSQMMRKFHKKMYQYTENIVLTIIKKSITTSEFMQDEIRKCIITAAEQLCASKIIAALNSMRDSKSSDIKVTFLLFVEVMIKNEKVYKKQFEWIWGVITQFHQEPQFTLRNECKKLAKCILQNYKDWKNDVMQMKKQNLDKIDKILKNLNSKGSSQVWIEIQNHQFQKALLSKVMTSKYFSNSFAKFQELDKTYTFKKNWKDRIKLLNDVFQAAFDYPSEFQSNTNIKKYFQIAIDHIDQKNPGLLLNALNIFLKSVEYFPHTLQDCLGQVLEKTVTVIQTRRGELVAGANKLLSKIYHKYDLNKIIKQYLKICGSNNNKAKGQSMNQLIFLLRENDQKQVQSRSIRQISLDRNNINLETQINNNSQNMIIKSLIKLCLDKSSESNQLLLGKLKQLVSICQHRFGQQFTSKMMTNDKMAEFLI